jgi:hypothetical protein
MPEPVMEALHIGVSPWIIQDGNYGDFAVGDEVSFALEFYSEGGLHTSGSSSIQAEHVSDSIYRITAEVVHAEPSWWVIDFGLRCFREETPPAGVRVGDRLEGQVYLGIDPFFYFEYLHALAGAPPLVYEWQIDQIYRTTAPTVLSPDHRVLIPDRAREVRTSIDRTDAWHDEGGQSMHVDYVLHCGRLGGPRYPAKPGAPP